MPSRTEKPRSQSAASRRNEKRLEHRASSLPGGSSRVTKTSRPRERRFSLSLTLQHVDDECHYEEVVEKRGEMAVDTRDGSQRDEARDLIAEIMVAQGLQGRLYEKMGRMARKERFQQVVVQSNASKAIECQVAQLQQRLTMISLCCSFEELCLD
ncbi:hypothetical protein PFICI_00750 [Pestalotiopsis fici W106-1]|uniref:Uncharacterized protein n=1 Tax=Pestalotiopsis fici (strain W106-1 / CGMCC3.15140) TaxID=1229662 RepID=W3XN32_PESFW|nr:uncharacterized protein PFICI_00750 [Pestalotiopsis fici W106-1]ETS86922.1 hypothetical protein PFICI_00750 [Pestalotiopsis fici W106-1]